jgi:hypothetical protein
LIGMGRGPLLIALAVAVLGLAACEEASEPPSGLLPAALADALADRSEEIASQLDAGDACAASRTLGALSAEVQEAASSGEVPAALRGPIEAAISRLDEIIVCAPTTPPPTITQTETETIPPPTTTEPPAEGGEFGP